MPLHRIAIALCLFLSPLAAFAQSNVKACPAYPETNYFDPDCYMYVDELQLGQAQVRWPGVWGDSPRDLYIPSNKPEWAIASIHAWQVMRNTVKGEYYDKHVFLATAIKESFWNCDPTIDFTPLGLTYDITTNSQGNWSGTPQPDGCFHLASGGKTYLRQYYPWRHTTGNHAINTDGNNFVRGTLSKVHYDLLLLRFKEYSEGLDPLPVLRNAGDPFAADIWNAKAYNRGYKAADIEAVMQDANRIGSMGNNDWLTLGGLGYDYTETVSHVAKVLSNQYTGAHPDNVWNSWYDHQIDWALMDWYIDEIHVMYNELSAADIAAVKATVQAVFNTQDADNDGFVSFRFEFGPVLDAFILAMPYDDPLLSVINTQSSEGGCLGCVGPVVTVWPNGPTEVCDGIPVELETIVGNGYTYQWKRDGVDINNPNTVKHFYYATQSGSYTVDVTNASGCLVSAECPVDVTVNVCSNCDLTATPTGTPNSCTGIADGQVGLVLGGSAYNGSKAYTYEWTLDGQTTITSSATLPNIIEGSYTIQVVDPDDANCTASTFVNIEEQSKLYYDLELQDTEINCDEFDLTADISGSPPSSCTYHLGIWATNAGFDGKCWGATWTANESNPGIKLNGSTAVNIPTVSQSASGNCMYDTMSFTVNRGDAIDLVIFAKKQGGTVQHSNFEFVLTDPQGQPTTIPLGSYASPQEHIIYSTVATCDQPSSAFTFDWTPSTGLTAPVETDTSSDVTATITGHTTYVVEAVSPDYPTCILRDSVNLLYACGGCTTPTNVQLTASNGGSVCAPGTVTLTASADPSSYNFEYTFYDQNGVVQAASASNTFNASASEDYYVVVTDPVDPISCTATSSDVNVAINSSPVASLVTTDLTYCGTGVDVEVTNVVGATYSWSGASAGALADNDNVLDAATADTYSVDIIENGCTTTVNNIIVTESSPSNLGLSGEVAPACNSTETYTATGGQVGSTYIWTFPSGASGSSTSASIDVTFAMTSGDITVQEDLGGGCLGPVETLAVNLVGCSLSADFIADKIVICEGDTVVFTDLSAGTSGGSTYAWDFGGGTSLTGTSGAGPHQVVYATAGNIDVNLDVTEGVTVSESKASYVVVNGTPDAPLLTGAATICEGGSETYTVSNAEVGATYSWSMPTGFSGNSTTASMNATAGVGASDGDIVVTVDLNGCSATSAGLPVTVSTVPEAAGIVSGSASICLGDVEIYSIPAVTGADSYSWILPSGLTGTSSTASISLTASGLTGGDIVVTPQNACGDGATSTLNVFIGSTPDQAGAVVSSSTGNFNVCVGDQVDYTVSGVTGADQFDWVVPANATITSGQGTTTLSVSWTAIGNNAITVTPSSANCGNGTVISQTVNVGDVPDDPIGIIGSAQVCANSQENYTVDMGAGVAVSYIWTVNNAAINGSFTQSSVTVGVGGANFDLSVVAVNGCGNSGSVSTNVIVGNNLQPTVSILDPGDICDGTSTTFTANIGTAGSNPGIVWTLNNGPQASTTNSANITVSDGDIVEIEVTSDAACKDPLNDVATSQWVVSTISEPVAGALTVSPSSTVCDGETIDLSLTLVTNADDYQWSLPAGWVLIGTGNAVQAQVNGSSGSVIVTPTNAACFPAGGQSAQSNITVNSAPANDGILSGPTDVCENVQVTYSTTAVTGATSYNWTIPAGATLVADNGSSIDVTWSGTGGVISVEGVNTCGATLQSSTVSVSINSSVVPTLTLSSSQPGNAWCENEDICVTASLDQGTLDNISWSCDASVIAGETNLDVCLPAVDGCQCSTLYADATVTTGCGMVNVQSDILDITCDLLPELDPSLTGPFERCEGAQLTVESQGQAQEHIWKINDVEVHDGALLDRTLLVSDEGDLSLEVSNNNSCGTITSTDMALQVHMTPELRFVDENGNAVVEYITLEDNSVDAIVEEGQARNEGLFDISWSGFTGLVTPTSTGFVQEISGVPGSDVLSVTVSDLNDQGHICASTISIAIEILETLKVPNVISPNGDGINDNWQLKAIEAYPDAIVRIFNRWGEELTVYTGGYQNNPWDGTTNEGEMLPVGTYYYTIDLKDSNNPTPLEGFVELMR